MALTDRLSRLNQTAPGKQRLVADLPAEVQLNAIQKIASGQSSGNAFIDDFVKQGTRQGRTPEQIRNEFITNQRRSAAPLIIMGG